MSTTESHRFIAEAIDVQYLVKEVPHRGNEVSAYEVSKFMMGKAPAVVYRVAYSGRSWSCDCPGFMRSPDQDHKHIVLVKYWLASGKPQPFEPGYAKWALKAVQLM